MSSQLTAIVPVVNINDACQKLADIHDQADVVELRIDYLPTIDFQALSALMKAINLPIILTLRSKDQGGLFVGDKMQYRQLLEQCLALQPDYLDIEYGLAHDVISQLHQRFPASQLICSSHNFQDTPHNLDALLQRMQHPDIAIYKIVTYANSTLDALYMMQWVQQQSKQHQVVGHCMGELGLASRIAGAVLGNYFSYAALNHKNTVVEHQITLNDFNHVYFIREKNADTQFYALIGDPVSHSIGHLFHNQYFHDHNINAIYFKLNLQPEQLSQFFHYCQVLPFAGLSVTMPLKQAVLPFVENQTNLPAINTIKFVNKHGHAINTDGSGALDAIEQNVAVRNKKILVIGAGGAASTIVQEALQRGANVTVVNRSSQHAAALVALFPITIYNFKQQIPPTFDLVINTIPNVAFADRDLMIWLQNILAEQPWVMNINYNQPQNPFDQTCQKWGCQIIPGELMFIKQAQAQLRYWLNLRLFRADKQMSVDP